MSDIHQLLLTLTAQGVAGPTTATAVDLMHPNLSLGRKRASGNVAAIAVWDITALTGTALLIDAKLVGEVGGVDYDIVGGGFTQVTATGAQSQVLNIVNCPEKVKVVWQVAGTTPALTATVRLVRL